MSNNNFTGVFSVLHVNDFNDAVKWYSKWLQREPDVSPTVGVAEWQLVDNGWIQVSSAPDTNLAGKSFVVCGVHNIEVQIAICQDAGITVSETQDLGFIKLAQINDPSGNTVMFIQEMQNEFSDSDVLD